MKRTILQIAVVLSLITVASAQLPDAPHKFWDKKQAVLFAVDAGAKAFDAYETHQHVTPFSVTPACYTNEYGGQSCPATRQEYYTEGDPIAKPFVKYTAGQVAYFSLSLAADTGLAYFWHRTGHHKLERWTMALGAAQSTGFASTWIGRGRN